MRLVLLSFLAFALPASAQQFIPMPLTCSGADPDWAMSITEDGTLFEYGQAVDTELDIAWETPAEGAAWPRVLTLLGRGTSAIVILEQPRDATYPIRILTQRGETPLLLVGGCSEF